ncbi:histidine phosphatase family protein [Candidatus Manganitrophus noduliformans]|uniref:phosphoglycerate mutase (2,3-diphosphoglycerate-dependent) n=1 Tax=Candidatus Manganitrophus noduliformans TaxID=2606439 RepID=A0A7X6DUR2_9BACT|nr:histidine phosphatase family protein [Candidatus Manganitrophus noduliformans]NKE73768.1 histidine phosphatase family protein [Candidatus Manganitrophus noduliformans]
MKEGRIFLIRHGKTEWNGERYLGWEDVPLSETGKKQADEIDLALQNERIDIIYSSPLTRAVETISSFAQKRGIPVYTAEDLRELHYGRWQGLCKSKHKLNVIQQYRVSRLPQGESLFDVYLRAVCFRGRLESDLGAGKNVAVVGHFWSNRMLEGVIRRVPFKSILDQPAYRPKNGSLLQMKYRVEADGELCISSASFVVQGF